MKKCTLMPCIVTSLPKDFGYVKQLSDPALEGRLAGSPGMAKAVDIVKGYFKEWKLIPRGENGSYIQLFPHPCVEIQPGSTMDILFPVTQDKKKLYGSPRHTLGQMVGLPEE